MAATRRLAAALALSVLAAGCGSTVENAGGTVAGSANGLSGPGGAAAGTGPNSGLSVPGATAGGALGNGGAVPGAGTAGAGAAAGGTAGSATQGGTVGVSAPGVTATSIYVGMVYETNGDALNAAAGANGLTTGDEKADGNAIVDDINKHGGIAGRKLVPVWAPLDATSTQSIDSQWAAICAQFTQDKRVFAVLGEGVASYRSCIQKAGIVQLDADLPAISDAEFNAYPDLIEMGYPRLSRIAKAQLEALQAQNYFTPWNAGRGTSAAKCGVLTYDDNTFTPIVTSILVPGLKRLGCDPGANVAKISQVSTAADYSNQASAVQSAVLKFNSAGVNHVITFESNGGLSLFFMNEAESQHYHPRYGVSSTSGLQALIGAGDVQKDQANGAVGFGWIPGVDLPSTMNPDNGPYSNAERKHCLAVYRAHGITFSDVNAEGAALEDCANLYLLRLALDKTPQVITPQSFVGVVNGLGSAYQPAGTLGSSFASGRHDSPVVGYHWAYFSNCQCMHYTGKAVTIPS